MIRLRPSQLLFRATVVGSLLPCFVSVAQAQSRHRTTTSIQTTVEQEEAKRAGQGGNAETLIRQGDADVIRLDYESAVNDYRGAVDSLNDAPATSERRKTAIKKFFNATIELANERIVEGRYLDAETTVKVILLPQYDPGYKPAIRLLKDLEDPEYFNQTVGPKFIQKVDQVKGLFRDAQGYYDSARYDLAFKRYEQILALDPYNDAARMGEEKIDRAKFRHSEDTGYPETRARFMADLSAKWEMAVPRRGVEADTRKGASFQSGGDIAAMNAKLAKIIIPNIEFRSTTISDAIEFLRQEARRLDPDPNPENRGVNIFLKLPAAGARVINPTVPAPADATAIPGLPTESAAPAPVATANSRITLTMSRLPLAEALRYVASQAGLKVKVEQYAVSIVPISENTEDLQNREYRVSPTFISNATVGGAGGALNQGATSATGGGGGGSGGTSDNTGVGTAVITRQDAKTFLEQSGVTFPPGASATYLASSSKLVVRNTQENLDLIDSLVEQSNVVIKQVEIESKFIEITQTNLKELSFDWALGQANVPGSSKVFFGGGSTTGGVATNTSDSPLNSFTNTTAVTAGNRTGTFGISANAIDALLFGGAGAVAAPGIFSVAGVFTDPQFSLVVRALNQQKGVDLLSAPRVTTKSGQKATIEIIREFIYPTQFQPPQIPQNFGSTGGVSLTGGTTGSSSGTFPVTPTTPTNFEKRNTGVTLEVEPVIGPDNYTIDLNLQPQVVDFDGFVNYGSPIQTSNTNLLGITTTSVITPNVINQPIFDTRKVSTSVSVYDGSTVVLGGLVREDIQKVNDKVPILGDVPLVGRLFRSKIDQNIKRNLVIFVTAHLIDPAGQLISNTEEEEEVVQPLNGPDYVAPTRMESIPSKK